MKKAIRILILIVMLIILGFFAYTFGLRREVTIVLNGKSQTIITHALTVKGILIEAAIPISPQDSVQPEYGKLIGWNSTISIEQARPVTIWNESNNKTISFQSAERIPSRIMAQAGINLAEKDLILWNGMTISLTDPLPPIPAYFLQYKPSKTITLLDNGQKLSFQTAASTPLRALWNEGLRLSISDSLSVEAISPTAPNQEITLIRAIPLTIQIGEQFIRSQSAAPSVGEALAEAGIALQVQDYSNPSEEKPLPADGKIRVFRVLEEIILEQTTLPYEKEYVADPELELDQIRTLRPGRLGVQITRVRVRYENGKEVSHITEMQWIVSEPQSEQIGYGTKVVIRTLQTPEGTIEYWRAVPVYATSYSPCRSGASRCYYGTASGLPVQRGVISVTSKWYRTMAGQRVYVPGYGSAVIGDIGGGIPGQHWIDLAFTDADFEPWHQNTILYFLTPLPANIPWILP